jgi:hypothetical protein
MNKIIFSTVILSSMLLGGCASVPLASNAENATAKSFPVPENGKAGLYVYRDSFVGKALKKDVYLDGRCLGETADRVFSISKYRPTNHIRWELNPNFHLII